MKTSDVNSFEYTSNEDKIGLKVVTGRHITLSVFYFFGQAVNLLFQNGGNLSAFYTTPSY